MKNEINSEAAPAQAGGHTPRTWRVSDAMPTEVFDGQEYIAHAVHLAPGHREQEQLANARLIAAAPDLLEALKQIAEIAESGTVAKHETGKRTWYASEETAKIARAAIAQVGGAL